MAKTKMRMLAGTGGEWQVGGKPWGEVSNSAGTTKPTEKQAGKIKRQIKKSGKAHKKRNSKAGITG